MGFATMAVMGASAASSAIGSYYSAKTQAANLAGQAAIADINAQVAENTAQSALLAGQREEQSSRLRTAQLKSTQRTGMAANGIDLGSDTALNILTTTDLMGEADANTIAANAVRSAWGYRTQGANYKAEAAGARATASGISPTTAAASSLLGSAGNVASSWYSLNKAGAFK